MQLSGPSFPKHHYVQTEEQRRMYASEKLENFRWISKVVATYSQYKLTDADLASENLNQELAELGQFAEMAYSAVPIPLLLETFSILSQPQYPLENYEAIRDIILVDSIRGDFAELPAYIAFRPSTRQLVVSISGTLSITHTIQDLRAIRRKHPSGRGTVHSGFWALYQGAKTNLMAGIHKGLAEHSPKELVLTGHSMGGSISYLLCMDLLTDDNFLLRNLKLQLAVFGVPRAGDAELVAYFHGLVASFQSRRGEDAFKEYSVKGYNDGVPALPPAFLGYRHFCKEPIYTMGGKLYRTPATESEHALFHILSDDNNGEDTHLFPKGGHNYYNGRDLEKFARRINWLDRAGPTEEGWEIRYLDIVTKNA